MSLRFARPWQAIIAVLGLSALFATGFGGVAPLSQTAQAAGVSTATATIGGYPVWAHFADPRSHNGSDPTIINELIRLVNAAPAGSTIQGTAHSITSRASPTACSRPRTVASPCAW